MSIEEIKNAIDVLKNTGYQASAFSIFENFYELDDDYRKAVDIIENALLKTCPDAQPNEPLTQEDATEMHGDPAYLCWPDGGEWVLIRAASPEKVELAHRNGILAPIHFVFDGGGKLYRRPPKED